MGVLNDYSITWDMSVQCFFPYRAPVLIKIEEDVTECACLENMELGGNWACRGTSVMSACPFKLRRARGTHKYDVLEFPKQSSEE